MSKRPISVTVAGWIYIVVGVVGIGAHITEFNPHRPLEQDLFWALLVRLLAVVAGVFMLRGSNWARWLAMAWIGFHVGLSSFHSLRAAIVHAVLFAVFAYLLFRTPANDYFRRPRTELA
jgi:hypothetical protein